MSYNTVKLKKYADIIEEYEAADAIVPGMLVEMTNAGKVQKHSSAGEFAEKMFALENELEGGGIDDIYTAEDRVQCWIAGRGDQVYAFLAAGETVAIGDRLESHGDGYLQKAVSESASATTYPGSVVGVALEALDLAGSGATATRLAVRIV